MANNRDYKNFTSGGVYHIYNRGNNKEDIFKDEQDFRAFLHRLGLILGIPSKELNSYAILSLPNSRIRITSQEGRFFEIYAFCLMKNHFHILIKQNADKSISKIMGQLCTSYSRYFNQKYKRIGNVFQDTFKSVKIESNPQIMWTSAYIHMNPVKDKITKNIEDYRWNSFIYYKNANEDLPILNKNYLNEIFGSNKNLIDETINFISMSKVTFDIQ